MPPKNNAAGFGHERDECSMGLALKARHLAVFDMVAFREKKGRPCRLLGHSAKSGLLKVRNAW